MPSDRSTILTFALAALRLMTMRFNRRSLFVTARRGSFVADFFFVATFRYPRIEFLRGPAGGLRSANLFASCPAARLPNTFDTGGAHGISPFAVFILSGGALARTIRFVRNRLSPISVSTWRTHLPFA